jgi:NAD(P)-dependent dehydrogenase (short-subunit alcohol dehydrogenase family)
MTTPSQEAHREPFRMSGTGCVDWHCNCSRGMAGRRHQSRIDTESLREAIGDEAETVPDMLPVRRFGTGDAVAAMVANLIRPESGYITGAQIHVDGGISA